MNKDDYVNSLNRELQKNSDLVASKLIDLIHYVPEKTKEINIGIFTSQDGDGMFSIYANPIGPDTYILQKTLGEKADIFDPNSMLSGIEPYVPEVDSFEVDFEVNDCIVDCVSDWLITIWNTIDKPEKLVPFQLIGIDDYGTKTPLTL